MSVLLWAGLILGVVDQEWTGQRRRGGGGRWKMGHGLATMTAMVWRNLLVCME